MSLVQRIFGLNGFKCKVGKVFFLPTLHNSNKSNLLESVHNENLQGLPNLYQPCTLIPARVRVHVDSPPCLLLKLRFFCWSAVCRLGAGGLIFYLFNNLFALSNNQFNVSKTFCKLSVADIWLGSLVNTLFSSLANSQAFPVVTTL